MHRTLTVAFFAPTSGLRVVENLLLEVYEDYAELSLRGQRWEATSVESYGTAAAYLVSYELDAETEMDSVHAEIADVAAEMADLLGVQGVTYLCLPGFSGVSSASDSVPAPMPPMPPMSLLTLM